MYIEIRHVPFIIASYTVTKENNYRFERDLDIHTVSYLLMSG